MPVAPARLAGWGVPPAVLKTTAWALCIVILVIAAGQLLAVLAFFSEVTIPLAIAMLTTALAAPAVDVLDRLGVPRGLAALTVVLLGLVAVFGLLTLVGTQVAGQAEQLTSDVTEGIDQVQDWLRDGPLGLSDAQLTQVIDNVQETVQGAGGSEVVDRAAEVGTTVTHVFTGLFIVLFSTYFFCAQGASIWTWLVQLFPRSARPGLDASGRVAWVSLTAFVRATVLVAFTDALGIAIGALVLGVPLVIPLGVLVFLGAFVPIIGAAVSGSVAVLVALVAQGPVIALIMLGGRRGGAAVRVARAAAVPDGATGRRTPARASSWRSPSAWSPAGSWARSSPCRSPPAATPCASTGSTRPMPPRPSSPPRRPDPDPDLTPPLRVTFLGCFRVRRPRKRHSQRRGGPLLVGQCRRGRVDMRP